MAKTLWYENAGSVIKASTGEIILASQCPCGCTCSDCSGEVPFGLQVTIGGIQPLEPVRCDNCRGLNDTFELACVRTPQVDFSCEWNVAIDVCTSFGFGYRFVRAWFFGSMALGTWRVGVRIAENATKYITYHTDYTEKQDCSAWSNEDIGYQDDTANTCNATSSTCTITALPCPPP
jgi:hypothetical protein